MGLCLESGMGKTAPAPKILQLLLAPMETAGVWYHCTQRHCSCVSIWVWFLKMLNVEVPSRLHGCFCGIAAFQKKSREWWTAYMLFSFLLCRQAGLWRGRGSVRFSGVVGTGSRTPGSCLAPTFLLPQFSTWVLVLWKWQSGPVIKSQQLCGVQEPVLPAHQKPITQERSY